MFYKTHNTKHFLASVILLVLGVTSCQDESIAMKEQESADNATLDESQYRVPLGLLKERVTRMNLQSPYTGEEILPSSGRVAHLERTLDEVMAFGDPQDPSFFAFNFADEAGFVLVSGDFRAQPILAFSDMGSFEIDSVNWDAGIGQLIIEYNDYVETTRDAVAHVSEDIYEMWEAVAADLPIPCSMNCDPNDPPPPSSTTYGPFLQTQWQQRNEFNDLAPVTEPSCTSDVNYPIGCVAVAMGQIMRYWEHPTSHQGITYNYGGMINQTFGANATDVDVATLLIDCALSVNMSWGCNGSTASTSQAISTLKNEFGYNSSAAYSDYSYLTLKAEMMAGRPVILRGCRTTGLNAACHAWVGDGLHLVYYPTSTTYFIHMNWGWGPNNGNGWYTNWHNTTLDRNYQYYRKIGFNIKP